MVPTYHATLSAVAEEHEALLMLNRLIKRKNKKFNQYTWGSETIGSEKIRFGLRLRG